MCVWVAPMWVMLEGGVGRCLGPGSGRVVWCYVGVCCESQIVV